MITVPHIATYSHSMDDMAATAINHYTDYLKSSGRCVWFTGSSDADNIKQLLIKKGVNSDNIIIITDKVNNGNALNSRHLKKSIMFEYLYYCMKMSGLFTLANYRISRLSWFSKVMINHCKNLTELPLGLSEIENVVQLFIDSGDTDNGVKFKEFINDLDKDPSIQLSVQEVWTTTFEYVAKLNIGILSLFKDDGHDLLTPSNNHYIFDNSNLSTEISIFNILNVHSQGGFKNWNRVTKPSKNLHKISLFIEQSTRYEVSLAAMFYRHNSFFHSFNYFFTTKTPHDDISNDVFIEALAHTKTHVAKECGSNNILSLMMKSKVKQWE